MHCIHIDYINSLLILNYQQEKLLILNYQQEKKIFLFLSVGCSWKLILKFEKKAFFLQKKTYGFLREKIYGFLC
jgi:hypothetical protein